jgi:catechol 2,3-dioxygenase-like lactoylglutathione lyase family enzyme
MPITVERVDFVSIPTQDVERARRFYLETLGLPLERDTPVGFEAAAGQVTFGIYAPEQIGRPFAPTTGGVALRVADVAAARAELEVAGVDFAGDTIDTGVCHMAPFRDPDGNSLMLHRRYAPL